ncbi:MAG: hypothetical protein EZS28_051435, partial [Streblomastix strix]
MLKEELKERIIIPHTILLETSNPASTQTNSLMTSARFFLKINQNTPMIQMNIEYKDMMIIIVTMMYLKKLIQYSYEKEINEEEERRIEVEARHNLKHNPFYLVINLFRQ